MKRRLAIVISHPIQYYAPLFKQLHTRAVIDIKVFYSWGKKGAGQVFDHGFGKAFEWDLPLLEGYPYEFLQNTALHPGVHHFKGIDNPDIVQRIEAFIPDAILVFGWSFKSHLKVLRYFFNKVPVWFRGDSTFLDDPEGIKKVIRSLFLRWVYSHINKAFVVGKNNYQYYINVGVNPGQLVYASHAVDNERFMEQNDELITHAAELRRALRIEKEDVVFLFAGKFETKKDPLLLLTAFQQLQVQKGVHLVFVGNGPLEQEMKLQTGNAKNIHFMEFQNQQSMPAVYRLADIFILPSRGPNETWGLAVNEAMASGCAVIVSDKCGCAADLVEDGITGYVFEAGDAGNLQQKMEKMINNRKVLNDIRLASREKIKQYSFLKICTTIEAELQQLSSRKMTSKEKTK